MSDDSSSGEDGEENGGDGRDDAGNGGDSRGDSRSNRALEADLPLDAAFELLRTERRREVLRYLSDADDDAVALSELVGHVATADGGGDARERAEVSLHHHELPKLEDVGLIDYDPRSRTIRYWGDPLLEELLTTTAETNVD